MNALSFILLAQAAAPAGAPEAPSPLMQFFPLILLVILFYFMLIRPQQKRQKEHQKLIEAVKTGDKVITSSGIHGLVANVKERTILVKVADNVKIEFDKAAITAVDRSADPATPAA